MPVDIRIRFGRAIRRIREAQKINQEEAAERCGLHRTYYSGVERGIRNVSLMNIEKIARGFGKACPSCLFASSFSSVETGVCPVCVRCLSHLGIGGERGFINSNPKRSI